MTLDADKTFSVFRLFYGEDDAEEFIPVVQLACETVEKRILADEGYSDPRIHYLASAEALCAVLEIKAARERLAVTRTGAVPREQDYLARIDYAKQLYKGAEAMCSDIIRDDGFLFLRTE